MAKSVDFAVRDVAGGVSRGMVAGDGAGDFIQVGDGDAVSLNLRKTNILKYERAGNDLHVVLTDGRVVDLSGYFDSPSNSLYISADGEITKVNLEDSGEGVLFANYSEPEIIGKWSPNDELAFLDGDDILAPVEEDTAGMAGFAPLLGIGPLLAGGAAVAGAAALGGGDGGGGGGGGGGGDTDQGAGPGIVPTVNEPDADYTLTTNTVDPKAEVSGTGEPGSVVEVTLGDQTLETTVDENGDWSVVFEDETFPSDGDLTSVVVVTAPDDTEFTLDGPDFLIDMTPPEVTITSGAESTSDVENLAEYADGISIGGTGEAGASITVSVDGQEQSTTIDANGNWSVTFTQDQLPPGEYSSDMTVTATDVNGNTTVLNDVLVVDTVLNVSFDSDAVTADNIVNAAEVSSGFTLSGTTDTDATSVTVTLNGKSYDAVIADNGTWSAVIDDATLSTGSYPVSITATDAAGNVTTITDTVAVDTDIGVTFNSDAVTADNIVNAAEVSSGFTLSGTTDTDATSVSVTLNGQSYDAVIAANGSWSVVIDDATLSTGNYPVSITATDAAGNETTITDTVTVDTDMDVAFSSANVTPDGVVNAAEAASGFTLSGTADTDAASVTVTLNGKSYDAVVGTNGNWTANITDSSLADGTYTATVTATDVAGNTANDTKSVVVNSTTSVGIDATQMSDNVISGSEKSSVILTGTAEAGATVEVSFGTGTRTVVADTNGTWTANFGSSEVPADIGAATITAVATDTYGNTATTSQTIKVDTVLDTLTVATDTPNSVLADGVVNATEASGGLLLTGTVEVGARSVTVALADGTVVNATVNASAGTWTARIDAADLPDSGNAVENLKVTAVDAYGNTGSTDLRVVFDTVVENFSVDSVTADNTVNGKEAAEGFAITGTVEAGSTVTVTLDQTGASRTISVGSDGKWSVSFGVDDLPAGTGTATYSISATDSHGNVLDGSDASAASGNFAYDLEAPEAPDVTWSTSNSGNVRAIYTDSDGEADNYVVSAISSNGTVTVLDDTATPADDGSGDDIYSFAPQSMNTYFVVTDVDAAGNESSTLTVSSETEVTLNLNRAGLDQFDFSKIDLDLADVNLTISADQINALTGHEKTLVIEGDSDDSVTVSGMTLATDSQQDMDGYTLYTLDDGDAKLYVDDSISTSVI